MPLDNSMDAAPRVSDSRASRRGPGATNIVFGLIVTAVGLLFLMHNLGVHYFEEFWNFWPVAIILIGLSKIFSGRSDERTFGWIATFIGCVFLAQFTLGLDVRMAEFWPVILIIVGVSIVTRAIRGPQPPREAADSASTLHERAIVGGIARKNTSQSFQGGELSAVMGGCEIDLRDARMAGPTAVIDCFTMWGGIVIQIPPDWVVEPKVTVIAAGFNDTTKPSLQPAGRLIIRGTAVMAGIEVKN